jgi:DNA-binding FrmR family transcriptional regulator
MPDQPNVAIARRLKRAHGHLETIIGMIERGKPCAQIAQQLQAVEGAIENAKKALIHDHIRHSLKRTLGVSGGRRRTALKEFGSVVKYL